MLGQCTAGGENRDDILKGRFDLICEAIACEAAAAVPAHLPCDEHELSARRNSMTEALRARPLGRLQYLKRPALHGLALFSKDFNSSRAMMTFWTSVAPS